MRILFVFFSLLALTLAVPSRSQFKPFSFEVDGQSAAIVSCKLLDSEGYCLKASVAVRLSNDSYTNTIQLSTVSGGNSIVAISGAGTAANNFIVFFADVNNNIYLLEMTVSGNVLSYSLFGTYPIQGAPRAVVTTLDITGSGTNGLYYAIVNLQGLQLIVSITSVDQVFYQIPFVATTITSNQAGALLVTGQDANCTSNDLVFFFPTGESIPTGYCFPYPSSSCDTQPVSQFVSPVQVLQSRVDQGEGTLTLYSLVSAKKNANSESSDKFETDFRVNGKKLTGKVLNVDNRERSSLGLQRDILPVNVTAGYHVKTMGFTTQGSGSNLTAVVSYERASDLGYGYSYIEGYFVSVDLTQNKLEAIVVDQVAYNLPTVPAGNLGFDRLSIGDVTLLRYTAPCFDTGL